MKKKVYRERHNTPSTIEIKKKKKIKNYKKKSDK